VLLRRHFLFQRAMQAALDGRQVGEDTFEMKGFEVPHRIGVALERGIRKVS
jgi:hypothetical protein